MSIRTKTPALARKSPSGPHFAEASCRYNGLVFHALAWNNKLLHLSFAQAAHDLIKHRLQARYPAGLFSFSERLQTEISERLLVFAAGRKQKFSCSVHPLLLESGTAFQQRVWRLLSRIPYGETRTYGDLARELGKPGCARAVGRACNANPLVLIIPCHRVVAKTGLGGFNGGREIKQRLLAMERSI
jgi:O-6-methylguanine DNA methyltransferase